jgi:hypothetical protein
MKPTVKITLNSKHIEALADKKIYSSPKVKIAPWMVEGANIIVTAGSVAEPYCAYSAGPYLHSMGSHSCTNSSFVLPITVGRYCSIAHNVELMGNNHPIERLTGCGLNYIASPIYDDYLASKGKSIPKVPNVSTKPQTIIGNDVWIGSEVVLARGIKIGNGAVIATHAVVTKDVPDYAIITGIPGEVKKYRFPEELRQRLIKSEWWEYDLADFCHLDTMKPEAFLDGFEKLKEQGLKRYNPEKIDLYELLTSIK